MMKQKVCKNKNCRKPLPEGYRYPYCEKCRNLQVDKIKKVGKVVLGAVITAGITLATKGQISLKNK